MAVMVRISDVKNEREYLLMITDFDFDEFRKFCESRQIDMNNTHKWAEILFSEEVIDRYLNASEEEQKDANSEVSLNLMNTLKGWMYSIETNNKMRLATVNITKLSDNEFLVSANMETKVVRN